MIDAVFFDLYETLITELDPLAPERRPWRTLAAERLGIEELAFEREWRARSKQRMTGALENHAAVLHEICQALGHTADIAMLRQLQLDRTTLKQPPFTAIDAAVLAGLQRIKAIGVKIGLISNCAPEEAAAWATCRIAPLIDDAVLSYQVGYMKPDPRIYHLACRRLAVEPQRAIFVGDGGSNELAGAAQVGLTPYWATWFLDRWPASKRARAGRELAAQYPALSSINEVVAIVEASRMLEGYTDAHR